MSDASPPRRSAGIAGLSLKGRALRQLALRELSRQELARKLAPHAESTEQVESLLDELERLGYLSAQRVVESLLHRRAERYGNRRIRQEIESRGLDPDDHAPALEGLRDSEAQRAQALWQRRFGTHSTDPRERARQSRFLLSRGFPASLVARIVRGEPTRESSEDDDAN
ncbi:MAG TPA: recombination regulator RecX [Thauera aminoaromatica]|nr:recombination regulator RecX [Thauera aminoaromatica]HMZ00649.1 recombination regulator RecX [Burkholderiaceae bacterium]HNB07762.1 recombination regulator RecX [Thauera aminoaromatica]